MNMMRGASTLLCASGIAIYLRFARAHTLCRYFTDCWPVCVHLHLMNDEIRIERPLKTKIPEYMDGQKGNTIHNFHSFELNIEIDTTYVRHKSCNGMEKLYMKKKNKKMRISYTLMRILHSK